MKSGLADAFYFLLADIRHDLANTWLTLLGLSAVVFCYFLLGALSNSLGEFNAAGASGQNLIVIQSEFIDPTDARMDHEVFEALNKNSLNQVQRISPVIYRHMRVDEHVIILRSAPLEDWLGVFHLRLIYGSWPREFGEVAVGEGAAQAYQWAPGSQVSIYGSTFTISGIVRSPGSAFSSIWMPLTQGLALFGDDRGYQALFVQAAPGADTQALKRGLEQHPLIKGKFSVFFEDTYSQRDNQLLRDLTALISVASFLALFGVTLGTYTSTNLSLVERSRELGVLRSIGFSQQDLLSVFCLRAVMLGWAGFFIGLGCAQFYIALQNSSNPLFVLGYPIRFQSDGGLFATGFAVTTGLALLGAALPALHLFGFSIQYLLREINP
jgi:ABC-type antimicrobial peptide transport system permease subunit